MHVHVQSLLPVLAEGRVYAMKSMDVSSEVPRMRRMIVDANECDTWDMRMWIDVLLLARSCGPLALTRSLLSRTTRRFPSVIILY